MVAVFLAVATRARLSWSEMPARLRSDLAGRRETRVSVCVEGGEEDEGGEDGLEEEELVVTSARCCCGCWDRELRVRACAGRSVSPVRGLITVPDFNFHSVSLNFFDPSSSSSSTSASQKSSRSSVFTLQCPLSLICVCTPSTLPFPAPQYKHSCHSKTRVPRYVRNDSRSDSRSGEGMYKPWAVDMCMRFAASECETTGQKRHCVGRGSCGLRFDSSFETDVSIDLCGFVASSLCFCRWVGFDTICSSV